MGKNVTPVGAQRLDAEIGNGEAADVDERDPARWQVSFTKIDGLARTTHMQVRKGHRAAAIGVPMVSQNLAFFPRQ